MIITSVMAVMQYIAGIKSVPADINPQAYLTWAFNTIADQPINRIDDLLPWNFTNNRLDEAA